jgi:hypothetical protein
VSGWQRESVAANARVIAERAIEFPAGKAHPQAPLVVRAADTRRKPLLAGTGRAAGGVAAQARPELLEKLTGEPGYEAMLELRHARWWDLAWYGGGWKLLAIATTAVAATVVLPMTFQNSMKAFGPLAAWAIVTAVVVAVIVKARQEFVKELSP